MEFYIPSLTKSNLYDNSGLVQRCQSSISKFNVSSIKDCASKIKTLFGSFRKMNRHNRHFTIIKNAFIGKRCLNNIHYY